jgi:hypothetical protein
MGRRDVLGVELPRRDEGLAQDGVCALDLWRASGEAILSERCVSDAARRPMGAYFRVNHRDLVAMHAALAETGFSSSAPIVHAGWPALARRPIALSSATRGVHAFALVAYDAEGFWLQNSWGTAWARQGFAHLRYDDWLVNGTDAWAARLGAPVELAKRPSSSPRTFAAPAETKEWAYDEVRPHVVSIGGDGALDPQGNIGTTVELLREIVHRDIPRITAGWKRKRIMLYAHAGLVAEDGALHRVSDYRKTMLDAEVYPLAFVWHSDAWRTIKDLLQRAIDGRRSEGSIDAGRDFVLDRIDDTLEPLARVAGGRAMWSQMKRTAIAATASAEGGARLALNELAALARADRRVEFHLVGHSAGCILHAPLVQYLSTAGTIAGGPMDGVEGLGLPIASCTLWAPALTARLFKQTILPALRRRALANLAVFTLDDKTEQDDDCANLYHKSLLYLVSNALDDAHRVPLLHPRGEPLVGLAACIDADPELRALFGAGGSDWIVAPNDVAAGSRDASAAKHHGDFDDDGATVAATLARMLGTATTRRRFVFTASAQRKRALRRHIDQQQDFALTR